MAGWSSLSKIKPNSLIFNSVKKIIGLNSSNSLKNALVQRQPVRMSGDHRMMPITPSRWQWHKTKDLLHYYLMVGLIPVGAVVFYCNVFIGPAELAEIPEGYVPRHWEYQRHPISRFLARYLLPSAQQEYEKYMHQIHEEMEKRELRLLERKILDKMGERSDYQSFYYRPMSGKYLRVNRDEHRKMLEREGDF